MAQVKAKKSDSTSKKIIDVKPDGDGAVGNSRSIIVNNRPILKDPMMAEVSKLTGGGSAEPEDKPAGKASDKAGDEDSERVVVRRENKIQPINSSTESAAEAPEDKPADETDTADAKEEAAPDKAAADTPGAPDVPADETKDEPEAETETDTKDESDEQPSEDDKPAEPEAAADTSDDTEAPKVDESPGGAQAGRSFDDTQSGQAEPANIEPDAKGKKESEKPDYGQLTSDQQKAVETGEYFLPIQTAEGRRVRREILAAALFVLILVIAWVDIMLDADLIKIDGVRALTNFFK